MEGSNERLGISFCRVNAKNRVTVSPGLAKILNGSTTRTSIKKGKFKDMAPTSIAGCPGRLVRTRNKTIALIEWDKETPFSSVNKMLQQLGKVNGDENPIPTIISVDAMAVEYERGEVEDHLGCIRASEYHQIVVYENRGEDLSHLKTPTATTHTHTYATQATFSTQKTGSQTLQEKIDAKQPSGKTGSGATSSKPSLMGHITSVVQSHSDNLDKTAIAIRKFFTHRPKTPPPTRRTERTRADKGQVSPPSFIPPTKPTDHAINALLEFLAIERATKQVHLSTCKTIMQVYRRENEELLKVKLDEADAAIYNNDTSQTIKGKMSGEYMTAYNSTSGFVPLDDAKTRKTGKPCFIVPTDDPLVVTARCTRIMLQDKILEMAETILRPQSPAALSEIWDMPKFVWINGVPGCGKTSYIVENFKNEEDIIITTTKEAANDLRGKIAHLTTSGVKSKVRTMASVLANGFTERREKRLLVDEAHMNHFGAIVMAAMMMKAEEVLIIGDVNQLPYIDRENLFVMKYNSPNTLTTINKDLFCTHRNPMDVAYALSEVYPSIYSSRPQIRSLRMERYTDANIPPDQQNTLYLVLTQEEKSSLISKGYGSGSGSNVLTVHESQGLTYDTVIVIQSKQRTTKLRASVPHAVVAVSRHTIKCTFYADDSTDTIGRFVRRAIEASEQTIRQRNLKMAIKHRDEETIKSMTRPSSQSEPEAASFPMT